MLKLILFYLKLIYTRISVYVVLILFVLTSLIINYLYSKPLGSVLDTIIPLRFVNASIVFVFSVIYVSIVIVEIYKKAAANGLAMSIMTAPYKRSHFIISKLIVVLGAILLMSIFSGLLMFLSTLFNASATNTDRLLYDVSIMVGNLIIMIPTSALLLFVSKFFSVGALLTTSLVISATLPTTSFLLSTITKSDFRSAGTNNIEYNHKLLVLDKSSTDQSIAADLWEHQNSDYRILAFIDPWYQLSSTYNMIDNYFTERNASLRWDKEVKVISSDSNYELNGKKYIIAFDPNLKQMELNSSYRRNYLTTINNKTEMDYIKTKSTELSALPFEKQLYISRMIIKLANHSLLEQKVGIDKAITDIKTFTSISMMQNIRQLSPSDVDFLNNAITNKVFTLSHNTEFNLINGDNSFGDSPVHIIANGSSLKVLSSSPYVDKIWIILFWSLFSVALVSATVYKQIKSDAIAINN